VNGYRSDYGAVQNRLTDSLVNLEVYSENLISAESRIRDADFAHETAEMAKLQIMQQAGMSVLSQTGSAQQGILSLIR
jgi:flagellin